MSLKLLIAPEQDWLSECIRVVSSMKGPAIFINIFPCYMFIQNPHKPNHSTHPLKLTIKLEMIVLHTFGSIEQVHIPLNHFPELGPEHEVVGCFRLLGNILLITFGRTHPSPGLPYWWDKSTRVGKGPLQNWRPWVGPVFLESSGDCTCTCSRVMSMNAWSGTVCANEGVDKELNKGQWLTERFCGGGLPNCKPLPAWDCESTGLIDEGPPLVAGRRPHDHYPDSLAGAEGSSGARIRGLWGWSPGAPMVKVNQKSTLPDPFMELCGVIN
jgi:hypothetical protein